ncbi:MAG: ABC transporter permease, partial [Anaerolineae bacterium]|nr:ABC transporter permease [Anaerolineae bacterium]
MPRRLLYIPGLAARRLLAAPVLALAAAFGLGTVVALVMSIPLYADGVYFRLLRQAVVSGRAVGGGTPLVFRFRYVGARDGPREWEEVQALDAYLARPVGAALHLPQDSFTRHLKTDIFRVSYPEVDPGAEGTVTWISLATVSQLAEHARVVSGEMPQPGDGAESELEVLVNAQAAAEHDWRAGDRLLARSGDLAIPLRVAGTWAPADPSAPFWSAPLDELALVPEETFARRISPLMQGEVYLGIWQIVMDGSGLHARDVAPLAARLDAVQRRASVLLPKVAMDLSPLEALQAYRRATPELTFLLFAFSVPLLVIMLVFIGLVGGLYVERQRNEIATLRSRGATRGQVAGIAATECIGLGLAAFLAGTPLGMALARLIGRAQSFLRFTAPAGLRIGLTPEALAIAIAAVGLAHAAQLLPTLRASAHTVVTYKHEQARTLRPPWWQRNWLDGFLLIPAAYGFYVLQRQGSLAAEGGAAVHDLFQNPLLFLTPALGLFALA